MDLVERLEAVTYDMRVRQALRMEAEATNLFAFVYIDEETLEAVQEGQLGYRFGLYWPRQVYGRVLQELSERGARAVALDVLFGELRPDHPPVQMADGRLVESDEFFASQLRRCTNSILALSPGIVPPALFLTNATYPGDISTDKDLDGILRRVRAFRSYRDWHPIFRQLEKDPEFGVDLSGAILGTDRIVFPRSGAEDLVVPLNKEGEFELSDFLGPSLPANMPRTAKPYREMRVWHMGIVLAACELGLDLEHAEVDLEHGRILLRGGSGVFRSIPVDGEGYFLVDWAMTPQDSRLVRVPMHALLQEHKERVQNLAMGQGSENATQVEGQGLTHLAGKLVIVGSAAVSGNDLVDRGATPFSPDTLLVAKHWNVANSILLNRFIRPAAVWLELLLILLMGGVAAFVTWRLRAIPALGIVLTVAVSYTVVATVLFVASRIVIPVALPVLGALLVTHVCLVTWKVVFEQADKRRVSAVLSTIVSPKVARELLGAEKLSLGGARREVTVLFADVRGFTALTDASQEEAERVIRQMNLSGEQAEAYADEQARQTLATVNSYLGTLAEVVLDHEGTLDKFIGDCVMAFWGAPTVCSNHALLCVRAAIAGQRAVAALNQRRAELNRQIEVENQARESAGLPRKPVLPILHLGTGINTGMATVGLMGSEVQSVVRQGNYTVFGREVNVASRLESLSGSSRILISQSTYDHVKRDAPELARLCTALTPVTVKGIRNPIAVYEVRWNCEIEGSGQPATPAGEGTSLQRV